MSKGTIALGLGLIAVAVVGVYQFEGSFITGRQNTTTQENSAATITDGLSITGSETLNPKESIRTKNTTNSISRKFQTGIVEAPNEIGDQIFIFGRVGDNNNQPLVDVAVATMQGFQKTVTDNSGHYRLPVRIPRDNYLGLIFLRSGYAEERISVIKKQMERMDEIEVNAVLDASEDTVSVTGVLRNEQGQTLENERIKLFSRQLNRYYFVLTNVYGEFHFEGVKVGQSYALEIDPTASFQQYKISRLDVTHNTPQLEIVLQAIHFGRLSGIIFDRDGVPIPGFQMHVISSTGATEELPIQSDESGVFELASVPSGNLKIVHRANPHFKVSGIALDPDSHQHVSITLDIGRHSVEGWVSDNHGAPIIDARVTLTGSHIHQQIEFKSNRWSNSDSNGFFRFDRIGDGIHDIAVQAKGHIPSKTEFPVGKRNALIHIVLLPAAGSQ